MEVARRKFGIVIPIEPHLIARRRANSAPLEIDVLPFMLPLLAEKLDRTIVSQGARGIELDARTLKIDVVNTQWGIQLRMVVLELREYTTLNHPEPEEDGTQLYSVHRLILDAEAPNGRRYERVLDDVTLERAHEWIAENGSPETDR